jgi:hypothetical protein
MVKLMRDVLTAADLAARVGVPDDEVFRTSITRESREPAKRKRAPGAAGPLRDASRVV